MKKKLIVVSGISGAGKTIVLNALEDLGYYCIYNLPVNLLDRLIHDFSQTNSSLSTRIAISIDPRTPCTELDTLPKTLQALRGSDILSRLIFVKADNDILVNRFNETRRKHPLSSHKISLTDALKKERDILHIIAEHADLMINTDHMQINDLLDTVRKRVDKPDDAGISLQFMSFGFKHGVPMDADFVFDVRCLPNPYWSKGLRSYTGKDQAIINFLEAQRSVIKLLEDIEKFFVRWIKDFSKNNRYYLNIAIGCTGGRHRSVYIVEQLAKRCIKIEKNILVKHRDIN